MDIDAGYDPTNRYYRVLLNLALKVRVKSTTDIGVPSCHKEVSSALSRGFIALDENGYALTPEGEDELRKDIRFWMESEKRRRKSSDEAQRLGNEQREKLRAEIKAQEHIDSFVREREILGRQLTLNEIFDIFGVKQHVFMRRVREYGMSPSDAVLLPSENINSMSRDDRLLSGWREWCRRLSMPETERDLVVDAEEMIRDGLQLENVEVTNPWLDRSLVQAIEKKEVGSSLFIARGSVTSSGVKSLGWCLSFHEDQPIESMYVWIGALYREFGPFRLPDGSTPRMELEAHASAKRFLPIEANWFDWDSIKTTSLRGSFDGVWKSAFELLGHVAILRAECRSKFYLQVHYENKKKRR